MRLKKEPAWHRRARKARTRARTTLRLFLRSGTHATATVLRAVRRLQGHHSQSDLRKKAIAKMQGQHSQQWWCCQCNRCRGAKAAFCHRCAAPQHSAAPRSTASTYTESWTEVPCRASSASRAPCRESNRDNSRRVGDESRLATESRSREGQAPM